MLVQAATRGDGETGEDVTPTSAPSGRSRCAWLGEAPPCSRIRGGSHMPRDDFERLNETPARAGRRTFVNPRNAAAGAVRQLDPAIATDSA